MDLIAVLIKITENKKLGISPFFIAFALIVIHHFNIITFTNQTFVDLLYIYAVLSLSIYSSFFYLEKKRKRAIAKHCPYCDEPLEELSKYKCPNCGVLTPEKEL